MKVSGFTIVRNAVKFDYPVVEAILSILPICDEFVVSVGDCNDGTLELIEGIPSEKIRIVHSVWDDSLREGGKLLSIETNKAFDAIDPTSNWAFYLQSDEVVHEKYHALIKSGMEMHLENNKVEGLLFNYKHFYGSYNYFGNSRKWYRNEIRIIRNDKSIRSYKDAQGFRKNDLKLKVKALDAFIYHYGWVKSPKAQQEKQKNFHKMWHNDEWMESNIGTKEEFDYHGIDSLEMFTQSHPQVMKKRIKDQNWDFHFDSKMINMSLKERFLFFLEKKTGWRPGEYKNYVRLD